LTPEEMRDVLDHWGTAESKKKFNDDDAVRRWEEYQKNPAKFPPYVPGEARKAEAEKQGHKFNPYPTQEELFKARQEGNGPMMYSGEHLPKGHYEDIESYGDTLAEKGNQLGELENAVLQKQLENMTGTIQANTDAVNALRLALPAAEWHGK
jgi:hypothetical protein